LLTHTHIFADTHGWILLLLLPPPFGGLALGDRRLGLLREIAMRRGDEAEHLLQNRAEGRELPSEQGTTLQSLSKEGGAVHRRDEAE